MQRLVQLEALPPGLPKAESLESYVQASRSSRAVVIVTRRSTGRRRADQVVQVQYKCGTSAVTHL